MTARKTATSPKGAATRRAPRTPARSQKLPMRRGSRVAVLAVLFLAGLVVALLLASRSGSSDNGYPFQVGNPSQGQTAPDVRLPATDGSTFDLRALRGKNVLLYFQEGVTCQPCWDQITDIEHHRASFRAAGIDELVTITTNAMGDLRQKAADEGVQIPVLSDPGFSVSHAYHANSYGMTGQGADGHSFVLVGTDGLIRWRADYGGAPNYTMFVPSQHLLADLHHGIGKSS